MSQSIPQEPVFPALPRLSRRELTQTAVAHGTALWESIVDSLLWLTLEFLSPLLLIVPPLEMWRERQEFFPDQARKGSLISSYEAETGLLWMWAGPRLHLEWRRVCRGTCWVAARV